MVAMEKERQPASCVARGCVHACTSKVNGESGLVVHPPVLDTPVLYTWHMHTDDRSPCFSLSSRDPACPTSAGHASAPHLDEDDRYERTFHTWPTAGTRLSWGSGSVSMHVTLLLLARSLLCVSEWVVTLLAAARENELSTLVSVGIQSRGTCERCFVVLGPVGLAPGVGRDWMSPAANYSSYQSRSSHPGLACVDMDIDDIGADVDSADPASAVAVSWLGE